MLYSNIVVTYEMSFKDIWVCQTLPNSERKKQKNDNVKIIKVSQKSENKTK